MMTEAEYKMRADARAKVDKLREDLEACTAEALTTIGYTIGPRRKRFHRSRLDRAREILMDLSSDLS